MLLISLMLLLLSNAVSFIQNKRILYSRVSILISFLKSIVILHSNKLKDKLDLNIIIIFMKRYIIFRLYLTLFLGVLFLINYFIKIEFVKYLFLINVVFISLSMILSLHRANNKSIINIFRIIVVKALYILVLYLMSNLIIIYLLKHLKINILFTILSMYFLNLEDLFLLKMFPSGGGPTGEGGGPPSGGSPKGLLVEPGDFDQNRNPRNRIFQLESNKYDESIKAKLAKLAYSQQHGSANAQLNVSTTFQEIVENNPSQVENSFNGQGFKLVNNKFIIENPMNINTSHFMDGNFRSPYYRMFQPYTSNLANALEHYKDNYRGLRFYEHRFTEQDIRFLKTFKDITKSNIILPEHRDRITRELITQLRSIGKQN